MPIGWVGKSGKREKAWNQAKASFKKAKGREPESDDDYKYVMGVAKRIAKAESQSHTDKMYSIVQEMEKDIECMEDEIIFEPDKFNDDYSGDKRPDGLMK